MDVNVSLEKIYIPSEDIVAREIEGEIIIVPLVAGIGDADDELYTLNETGQAVWKLLDGKRSLGEVAAELAEEFEGGEIGQDVIGFVAELLKRRILVEAS
ncbi:MAG: PqqD family protein [Desulfomonile tiedjei]|nr:PqqD family protein [Desulfomonile tiedjei]